jgi:iron complex outermembrane recepter protein
MELKDWSILNVAEFSDIDLGWVKLSVKDVFSYEENKSVVAGPGDGVGGRIQQQGAITFFSGAPFGSSNTLNGNPVPRLGPASETINNDFNISLDLDDGLLESVLGYYFSHTELPGSNKGTSTIYQLWLGILNPALEYQSAFDFNDDSYTRDRAWYTQSTLDLGRLGVPGLKLTAGYRKSWDRSSASGFTPMYDYTTGTYSPGLTRNTSRSESDGYNYLITLAQQITDSFMVYLTNTRAFVPGGINSINEGSEVPNYSPTYGSEVVKAWEVGTKLDFYLTENIPVRLNAAIYRYDFEDIIVPFQAFNGSASIGFQANAAAAELEGFELSATISPIENLTISFAYNYNDAEYTDFVATDPFNVAQPGDANCVAGSTPTNCLIDLSKNTFASMPKHQGHATVTYDVPLDSNGDLTLSATYYRQSRVWYDSSARRYLELLPASTPAISQESYSILNLRADWANVLDSGVNAAIFVNNATDEVYKLGTTPQLLSLGFSIGTYGPPRMMGVEFSKHF